MLNRVILIIAHLIGFVALSVIVTVRVSAETLPVISVEGPTVPQIMEGTQPEFLLRSDKKLAENLEISFLVEQSGNYIGPILLRKFQIFS